MFSIFKDNPRYLIAAVIVHAVFIVLFAISFHWTSRPTAGAPPTIKVRMVAEKKPEEPDKPVEPQVKPQPEEDPARKQQERLEEQRRQQEEQQRREEDRKQAVLLQEREKKRQKELEEKRKQEELQQEKQKRDKAFRDKVAAEQQRLDEEQKRRIAAQEQQEADRKRQETEAIARKAEQKRQQTIIDKYVALIDQKVRQNWIKQPSFTNKVCLLKIKMLPTGEVLSVSLARSSGDPVFDRSVEHAIKNASPLPLPPPEAGLFDVFRDLDFKFGTE